MGIQLNIKDLPVESFEQSETRLGWAIFFYTNTNTRNTNTRNTNTINTNTGNTNTINTNTNTRNTNTNTRNTNTIYDGSQMASQRPDWAGQERIWLKVCNIFCTNTNTRNTNTNTRNTNTNTIYTITSTRYTNTSTRNTNTNTNIQIQETRTQQFMMEKSNDESETWVRIDLIDRLQYETRLRAWRAIKHLVFFRFGFDIA